MNAVAPPSDHFTPREREILDLLTAGLSNKEIARRIGVGEGTVKVFVGSIMHKLAVHNRTQAALAWHRTNGGAVEVMEITSEEAARFASACRDLITWFDGFETAIRAAGLPFELPPNGQVLAALRERMELHAGQRGGRAEHG